VNITVPERAALDSVQAQSIRKIPGGGRSVTIDVMIHGGFMGGTKKSHAFDLSIAARTDSGETFTQDVFLDMNG
jgi:hypothetical protein